MDRQPRSESARNVVLVRALHAFRATATAICALALFTVTAESHSPTTQQDEEQLIASEKAWAKAVVDGDADRMAGYMADEYVELSWEVAAKDVAGHWSSRTKDSWLKAVRSRTTAYKSIDLRNLSVHLQGAVAVVTGEYSQTTFDGTRDTTFSGIYADTWLKKNGRWLVVHSVFP